MEPTVDSLSRSNEKNARADDVSNINLKILEFYLELSDDDIFVFEFDNQINVIFIE